MQKTGLSTLRVAIVSCLVMAGAIFPPLSVARAQAASDPPTPADSNAANARLQRIWLRQQRSLDRLEFMFDHAQQRLHNAQERIDLAKARGKDVSSLQAAMDSFASALQKARPDFESAKGIRQSHKGFDPDGNLTDADLAAATVQEMASRLDDVRQSLLQPARDLRDALYEFRRADPQPHN